MTGESPAQRYYRSLRGDWSGRLDFSITDRAALAAAELPARARLGWMFHGIAARRWGAVLMVTSLQEVDAQQHLHTTRITKGPIVLLSSEERISLETDGSSLTMRGEMQLWPSLGRPLRYEAHGEISPDASGACYRIPFLGTELMQTTRVLNEGLSLLQQTPWSQAKAVLKRREARLD